MTQSGRPAWKPKDGFHLPRLSATRSLAEAERKAREVLRERGLSEPAIDAELKRVRRSDPDR